jgi:hypothetical protein
MFLVILKMTAREALVEFTNFVVEVFDNVANEPVEQTKKLKRTIDLVLEKYGVDKGLELIPSGNTGAPVNNLYVRFTTVLI